MIKRCTRLSRITNHQCDGRDRIQLRSDGVRNAPGLGFPFNLWFIHAGFHISKTGVNEVASVSKVFAQGLRTVLSSVRKLAKGPYFHTTLIDHSDAKLGYALR